MNKSGTTIVLDDASNLPLQGLTLYGKSTQDGTPMPDNPIPIVSAGDGGTITVTVSDGADQSQTLPVSTPNGLPGIPVTSGGNYTDSDGQQWVCDEIDLKRGKYVQRVGKINVNLVDSYISNEGFGLIFNPDNLLNTGLRVPILSNYFRFDKSIKNDGVGFAYSNGIRLYYTLGSVEAFNEWLSQNDVVVYYPFATPIETDLTPEQMQAYAGLHTYHPNTTITNDADAWMHVQYISNSDLPDGPYSNPKTEIGKYYKALAGYSNEVPPPTCRETQLISKLLDANYQVPFENTTCSIEGYLWDMIRGTDVMANYTPKFESEKFLAMLTGKLVTDYPPKDCERNFWMARCVEAQARMKVLRRGGKSG